MINELKQAARLSRKALHILGVSPGHTAADVRAIKEGGLFDADFYRKEYPATAAAGGDLLKHYLVQGWKNGLEPSPNFSMRAYLGENADVRAAKLNPLVHWVRCGSAERRVLPRNVRTDSPWTDVDRPYPLPDDVVQYELLAGQAYFAGTGFDFEQREAGSTVADAAKAMAARTPLLSVDATSPKVSIIIPVYGQTHFVLNCLDSLARLRSRYSVEVMIADDASPAAARTDVLKAIPWIRYERRAENGGFLECCNSAVQMAKGEIVILLNSDTRVVDGWLDELVEAFELFPKAGMVGSKLFNADGTLQEAGGIFWRDGSAHNYGRNEDPNRPQYCFARQADFISGASIALRKTVWNELGGFDPEYKPAYCEDADLAFRLRRAGYEVWFVPTSRAVHYEGITHGRDTSKGIKAYQVTNLQKFAKRFSAELKEHPQPGTSSMRAASWRVKRSILVIDALTPTPDQDSGSIVTNEVMSAYRESGFAESFLPLHSPHWWKKYTSALQRRGVCCYYQPFAGDVADLLALDNSFDYALLYRYNVADVVYQDLRKKAPATRLLFANVDLHFLRETRAAETANTPHALFAAKVTKKRELEMFAQADASFIHTQVEEDVIQKSLPAPLNNLVVLPWISEVYRDTPGFSARSDIMFLGNFPHVPNVDSILFFMKSIWPALQQGLPPEAKLLIVGNKPPPEVLAMASDRVVVTGFVEELAPYFVKSRVFVAPLRYGAGIKGKLVTALAHGVPSVATHIAAEGIAAVGDGHLSITDDPAQFAAEVLRLYGDEASWDRMREAGLKYVEDNYSRVATSKICLHALAVADQTWSARQELECRRSLEKIMAQNGEFEPVKTT
ncbi:glycosyltransferase [Variovorax sp. PAMC26660]|uniref:glycosyltransferase n=1 Tax=Variovorax sp. PAMC26660 TaxID=2762322 RepID=UPI00164E3FDF|nr:glycosyltransferase [Variovorax sp. PAMC26660]QNK71083.1 glycosyltransferase [Variovorax sp. PAMC26660]